MGHFHPIEDNYTDGERLALAAALITCDVEKIQGFIVIGIPKTEKGEAELIVKADTSDIRDVIYCLNKTAAMIMEGILNGEDGGI